MRLFQTRSREQGVTLIELMVAIGLLAVFMTLAMPAVGDMMVRQRIKSNAATFASALTFAQAEAIRRNQPVYVVPGLNKQDGKLNGAATDWNNANAVLVFADDLSKGVARTGLYDSQEDLRVGNLDGRVTFTISARTVLVAGADDVNLVKNAPVGKFGFVFQSNGQMKMKPEFTAVGMGSGGYIGRIVVADQNRPQQYCRVIRVESLGRASVCDDAATRDENDAFCHCGA